MYEQTQHFTMKAHVGNAQQWCFRVYRLQEYGLTLDLPSSGTHGRSVTYREQEVWFTERLAKAEGVACIWDGVWTFESEPCLQLFLDQLTKTSSLRTSGPGPYIAAGSPYSPVNHGRK